MNRKVIWIVSEILLFAMWIAFGWELFGNWIIGVVIAAVLTGLQYVTDKVFNVVHFKE